MYCFVEEYHPRDNRLTREGETKNFVYLVWSGEVSIIRHGVVIGTVNNSLLGEEVLMNATAIHEYTSVVLSSQVRVLKIHFMSLLLRSPNDCIEGIRQAYLSK